MITIENASTESNSKCLGIYLLEMTTNENQQYHLLNHLDGIDLLEMTTAENAVFYWYAPDIGI